MPDTPEPHVSVTLAEIARIAGVGRAAVSNWRRRHSSFPRPVGGTDASPQFSLSQVEEWLRAQGKLGADEGGRERLWPRFEALGDRELMGLAIAAVGTRAGRAEPAAGPSPRPTPEDAPGTPPAPSGSVRPPVDAELSEAQEQAVEQAVRVAGEDGLAETFGFLLGRWLGTHVRQITTTPEPLAALMTELAELVGGGPGSARADGGPWTVLDPACGVGGLLTAAVHRWGAHGELRLSGQDSDPVLVDLAAARLALTDPREPRAGRPGARRGRKRASAAPRPARTTDLRPADSLREDGPAFRGEADVVLCNPPFNERDWGHAELATDPRWVYGHPPRTEPELAWVQHALACLRPGGTAVLLLPPAVASRRAGRRIRAALLRAGALRAVIALPPGAAPPHGVALHLWVLRSPVSPAEAGSDLLFVDAAQSRPGRAAGAAPPAGPGADGTGTATAAGAAGKAALDWTVLRDTVLTAVRAHRAPDPDRGAADADVPPGTKAVPVIDLLDEQVDLTPARHVPVAAPVAGPGLGESWSDFGGLLDRLRATAAELSPLTLAPDAADAPGSQGPTTVGELARAGALTVHTGQSPADGVVRDAASAAVDGSVPYLTVQHLLLGSAPNGRVSHADAAKGRETGTLTVTEPDDVVVIGSSRVFDAWVDDGGPTVLGPQIHALRVDPSVLDPWFLAGCLRAPANARQAGTHASATSRIDVRRLQIPRLPLAEQRRYGEVFRRLASFDGLLREARALGTELTRTLSDGLAAGRLTAEDRGNEG
ncbi:N-6 DNA methylase [Streptomyces sp. S07_1.15]|uniref:N-6 DNA methylase n=1 Tax=Streptomyces sp. S07_1.15 TaxID=2873925 RepID=UPI001D15729D|nr:N-6 DNA methylase [Streptomyces sp. S07_1.15]MCC3650832.1 N-6 DNA methylase [Streptomyces sp. S07_1.15]